MDLADRYLNSFCVKRLLANNDIEQADKTVSLFAKDGDQMNNLYDMQCMWYEISAGSAFFRLGELGKSLKKFLAVGKHFADITDDQYDFHTYCIRKMTLRSYIRMLRVEDDLYGHKYYLRGAKGAIVGYMKLSDRLSSQSKLQNDSASSGLDMSSMTPAEKKKLRNKLRKEAKERKQAEAAAEEAEKMAQREALKEAAKGAGRREKASGSGREIDPDPLGNQLLKCEDPLAEANKIVCVLERHSGKNFETHIIAFNVHLRRKKYLLALRAMKRAIRMDSKVRIAIITDDVVCVRFSSRIV